MPQTSVNSANIINFGFAATFDIYNRTVLFDTSTITSYQGSSGSGIFNVLGIAFSLIDSDGVELAGVDWANPQIMPAVNQQYTLDLSSLNYVFLFQNYKIVGYIKDADGTVYQTEPIYKKVCQPVGLTDGGYVNGIFQVIPDCVSNNLTVKELTVLAYNNLTPESVAKSGQLYYPTGTIDPIVFTGTPFSNNVIYTGEYRVTSSAVGTYNIGDNIYILVTYLTNNTFSVTCTNRIADLLCCVRQVQDTAVKHCNDAIGAQARQKMLEISPYLSSGLLAEINGMDASFEADFIKKALSCNCGGTSIHQNEMTPINPSVYSIVLKGVGGTTIPSPSIVGTSKQYSVASNIYQVTKGNLGDLAFKISTDTSVAYTVKYVITFDYAVMAGYILTAFENDSTYIARLQALLVTGINLSGLNGKCVLNTATAGYTLQLTGVNSATLVGNIVINGTNYAAPANLHANDSAAVQTWLNTLSLGTFAVSFSLGVITISSAANSNILSTVTFLLLGISSAGGNIHTVMFQSSSYTLVQVLQAIIDYLCGITALQVALGNALLLYQIDYNGNITQEVFTSVNTQNDYNIGLQNSIYNIIQRIDTLTGITCDKLRAIFVDRPTVSFGDDDRIYGTLGKNCAGLTDLQIATLVLNAVTKYSDVKTMFCAIDCLSPSTCPDVADISLGMSGSDIGIYGLTWATATTATQTVTLKYKNSLSLTWFTATNALLILPNGNISGTTPAVITGIVAGQTYDIMIVNNCGGVGFSKQITAPTSAVYSGSYYLENSLYLICGVAPVTLYSAAPFAAGVAMFADIGLTVPVTGYLYITIAGSNIFALNSSTGVVGVDTGSACTTGTAGSYRVDTSTATICAQPQVTYYTNGSFVVGGTLYQDVALTTPVTGYTYVLRVTITPVGEPIYNLNSVTGEIGASTGLTCA